MLIEITTIKKLIEITPIKKLMKITPISHLIGLLRNQTTAFVLKPRDNEAFPERDKARRGVELEKIQKEYLAKRSLSIRAV